MKTIKLTPEAWKILQLWKLEKNLKTFSEAIIEQDKDYLQALNIIGERENEKK